MEHIEEQATGCSNAHSYKEFAKNSGFKHIEILNRCSSAGDWQFLVSKDKNEWFILFQENNYPKAGFSHSIDLEHPYYGTLEEVLEELDLIFS